jgi:histidinol-phosphatase
MAPQRPGRHRPIGPDSGGGIVTSMTDPSGEWNSDLRPPPDPDPAVRPDDPAPDLATDLDLALRLAAEADAITRARFGALDLKVDSKPDLTPVSDADLAVEKALRATLGRYCPEDAVLGEEFGGHPEFAGRQWVIDPIDGTKNFVRGVPIWATLIALLQDGVPVVGVVSAPALARRWWAGAGSGAWMSVEAAEPQAISVSAVPELASASLAISSLSGWRDLGLRDQLIGLTDEVWRTRGYGDFFSYCLLAEGAVDIATEPEVSLWDLAPLDILVREAGGAFTALDGTPGPHSGSAVATNGLIHEQVLSRLRG